MPKGVYQRSPEQLVKLAEQARRVSADPAVRAKRSAARMGVPRTAETIAKMSASLTGRSLSDEQRAAISAGLTGHAVSDKTRAATIERNTSHGHAKRKRQTPTYQCWAAMLRRCRNTNDAFYHRYGGRGIRVCDRWLQFPNFLADMGERPDGLAIDRVDNDGDYEPGNCRWATAKEQANNRGRSRAA